MHDGSGHNNNKGIRNGKYINHVSSLTGYLPINYEISWMDSSGMAPSDGVNSQFRSQRGSTSTSPAVQSNLSL